MPANENTKFPFQGIDHIALLSSDMARTTDFYCNKLGMPLLHTLEYEGTDEDGNIVKNGQHFFFGVGGDNPEAHLAFFYYPPKPGEEGKEKKVVPGEVGWFRASHINFRVSADRIQECCQKLKEAGIEFSHSTRVAGPRGTLINNQTVNEYHEPEPNALMSSVYFFDPDGIWLEFNAWLPGWESWPNDAKPWAAPVPADA